MFCFKSIAIGHFIVWLQAQLLKRLPSVSFTVFRFPLIHVMPTRGTGVLDTSIRDESTSERAKHRTFENNCPSEC